MGVFPRLSSAVSGSADRVVRDCHNAGEAKAARDAGADAIVAQASKPAASRIVRPSGRGKERRGLLALIPRLADRVDLPIIAPVESATAGVAAALALGASAAMLGTAFCDAPKPKRIRRGPARSAISSRKTPLTRAFTGRLGRAIATGYVKAAALPTLRRPRRIRAARAYRFDETSRRRRERLSPHAGVGRPVGGHGEAIRPKNSRGDWSKRGACFKTERLNKPWPAHWNTQSLRSMGRRLPI